MSSSVKLLLDGDGTFDNKINKLIDDAGESMPVAPYDIFSRKSIINLSEDTIDRLRSFSLSEGESIENIVVRLLLMRGE